MTSELSSEPAVLPVTPVAAGPCLAAPVAPAGSVGLHTVVVYLITSSLNTLKQFFTYMMVLEIEFVFICNTTCTHVRIAPCE